MEEIAKKPFYKRWWFLVLGVIIVAAAALASDEDDLVQGDEGDETEEVHSIDFQADVAFEGEEVHVSGSTTLADSSLITLEVEHIEDHDYFKVKDAEVQEGKFESVFDINDYPDGEIAVYYEFNPSYQPDEIQELYGSDGEFIEGDAVKKAETSNIHYIAFVEFVEKDTSNIIPIDFAADIHFQEEEIVFSGNTNLVDGALITIDINHTEYPGYFQADEVEIQGEQFESKFDIGGYPQGEITVEYEFLPGNQLEEIVELYGEAGEFMEGDAVKPQGSLSSQRITSKETFMKKTADTHSIEFQTEVHSEDDEVSVSGDTNFENGTLINVEVIHLDESDLMEIDEVEVQNGQFESIISIPDFPEGLIAVYSEFHPDKQTEEIQQLYGSSGEFIEGEAVLHYNFKNMQYITTQEVIMISNPIRLTGSGDTVTEMFELTDGFAVVDFSHSGERNFSVKLMDESGTSSLLANEIGNYSGTSFELTEDGEYLLEINADGEWSVSMDQSFPAPSNIEEGEPHSLSGIVDSVIFLSLEPGLKRIDLTHSGGRNFIVKLNGVSLWANEIGSYSGATTEMINEESVYAVSVIADGEWTIDIE
ncbi:hypothetical protein [Alkalicoccus chagannorensis]|uniref:hypothetical protein n=1 Tax=Alkalicoccus chagannorensis TaxID=427072 RepID=UPI000419258D|nr:hypothetical protein [Alkalicoccus chagannorensis]